MRRVEELVEEILVEGSETGVIWSATIASSARWAAEKVLERLRAEGLLVEELPVEVLEAVRGNLLRGLEREEVPESTVLPAPPRARRFPREGVRMLCLEDDEEGRVCYLDLGHEGAHGFEAASDAG